MKHQNIGVHTGKKTDEGAAFSKKDFIEDAIKQGKSLEITYTNSYGCTSTRTITPFSIKGDLFEAFCDLRKGNRTFRISRVKEIKKPARESAKNIDIQDDVQ